MTSNDSVSHGHPPVERDDEVTEPSNPGGDYAIGVEPDEPPVRFVVVIGVALTVIIVLSILFTTQLMRHQIDVERAEKGYTDAPAEATEAAPH